MIYFHFRQGDYKYLRSLCKMSNWDINNRKNKWETLFYPVRQGTMLIGTHWFVFHTAQYWNRNKKRVTIHFRATIQGYYRQYLKIIGVWPSTCLAYFTKPMYKNIFPHQNALSSDHGKVKTTTNVFQGFPSFLTCSSQDFVPTVPTHWGTQQLHISKHVSWAAAFNSNYYGFL